MRPTCLRVLAAPLSPAVRRKLTAAGGRRTAASFERTPLATKEEDQTKRADWRNLARVLTGPRAVEVRGLERLAPRRSDQDDSTLSPGQVPVSLLKALREP
jgi:hypothetical protein